MLAWKWVRFRLHPLNHQSIKYYGCHRLQQIRSSVLWSISLVRPIWAAMLAAVHMLLLQFNGCVIVCSFGLYFLLINASLLPFSSWCIWLCSLLCPWCGLCVTLTWCGLIPRNYHVILSNTAAVQSAQRKINQSEAMLPYLVFFLQRVDTQ